MLAGMQDAVGATAGFGALDWVIVVLYFALLVGVAVLASRRKQKTSGDYFLGSNSVPAWAAALSLLATATSAVTFIGGPQEAYGGDLTYLMTNAGMIIAALVVAFFFVPVFYSRGVGTVYELLGDRYGGSARVAASGMFLVGRVFASGARLFIGAIPLSMILFGDMAGAHMSIAVLIIVVGAVGFTIVGGVSSVIWTDVLQFVVFVGAAGVALVLLLRMIPVSGGELIEVLRSAEVSAGRPKMRVADWGFDLSRPYTVIASFTGFVLLGIGAYGTDQDMAQRLLTCKDAKHGALSIIIAQAINIPVVLLFLTLGLLMYVVYQRPDVMGGAVLGAPPSGEKVMLHFIMHETPVGVRGLMVAGVLAAALSSLNSALHAMSSSVVTDLYRSARPLEEERHYVRVGRVFVGIWAAVLGSFALVCIGWYGKSDQTLISFALGVMTFAYAGLVGVFLNAVFTGRGSTRSVLAALVTGFVVVTLLRAEVWPHWVRLVPVVGESWSGVRLSFAWPLTAGVVASFVVCALGRSQAADSAAATA